MFVLAVKQAHTNNLISRLCQDRAGVSGIYQWNGAEQLTKYAMAQQIAAVFGLSADHVTPARDPPSGATKRPMDSRLDVSRLAELGIAAHTPFAQGMEECLRPWVEKQEAV